MNAAASALSPRQVAESLPVDELIEIIHAQPRCDSKGLSITGFVFPPENPAIYIKYGDNIERGTDAEARSQTWAYESLQQMPLSDRQSIYIPEIYRTVLLGTWTCILMEYVPGKTLRDLLEDWTTFEPIADGYFRKIERALKLFLSFPVPQNAPPGPYGGGLIRHPLFRDYQASIEYPTVDLLEKHLNKVWWRQSSIISRFKLTA